MNSFVKASIFLAVVLFTVNAAELSLPREVVDSYAGAFGKFIIRFNKHYSTKEEYDAHLVAYATSMEKVKQFYLNNPNSEVQLGETSRSDFIKTHTFGYTESHRKPSFARRDGPIRQPRLAENHTKENIPEEFNWFDISGVKPEARNQGGCGCCWSFAAIGSLQMQSVLERNEPAILSPQQVIDCTGDASNGCCGGDAMIAYEDSKQYYLESDYPYELENWVEGQDECRPEECRAAGHQSVLSIRGYDYFYPQNAQELKETIWMYGPGVVGMNCPDELSSYTGGIFDCSVINVPDAGHAVIAVGFGKDYIVIRNSWGPDWGLEGDFLISDKSMEASCGIVANTSYVRASAINPQDPDPPAGSGSVGASSLDSMPSKMVFGVIGFILFAIGFAKK